MGGGGSGGRCVYVGGWGDWTVIPSWGESKALLPPPFTGHWLFVSVVWASLTWWVFFLCPSRKLPLLQGGNREAGPKSW